MAGVWVWKDRPFVTSAAICARAGGGRQPILCSKCPVGDPLQRTVGSATAIASAVAKCRPSDIRVSARTPASARLAVRRGDWRGSVIPPKDTRHGGQRHPLEVYLRHRLQLRPVCGGNDQARLSGVWHRPRRGGPLRRPAYLRPRSFGVCRTTDIVSVLDQERLRSIDIVSCFSVLHHFVLGNMRCSAEESIRKVDAVTGTALFLDTAECHEKWFAESLAGWDAEFIRKWLKEHTSFTRVEGHPQARTLQDG